MIQDKDNTRHWIADEGKVFRRKKDGFIAGPEMFLGYTHYLGGEKLPEPKKEIISQYEEIDMPEDDSNELLNIGE